jgi:hypothetical protein
VPKSLIVRTVSALAMVLAACVLPGRAVQAGSKPGVEGTGELLTLRAFQKKRRFKTAEMKRRFGAVGRIVCPFGSATAFLIRSNNVFITSDHLFFDREKDARIRGELSKCSISFFFGGRYRIDARSVIHGFKTTKTAYLFNWNDWAAGKLTKPVQGVEPFELGPANLPLGAAVTVISGGMNDAVPRVCAGALSSKLAVASVSEITTTCSSAPGASGGPTIAGSIDQTTQFPLIAIGLTRGALTPYWKASIGNVHNVTPLEDGELMRALEKLGAGPRTRRAAETIP